MSDSLQRKYNLQPEEAERIRAELRAKSQPCSQEAAPVRPTEVGLVDPSTPLPTPTSTPFCRHCGANQAEPFGPHGEALKIWSPRVIMEIYRPAGVILLGEGRVTVTPQPLTAEHGADGVVIYDPGGFAVSTHRSRGMGSSGQFGYSRTIISPEK